jgi:SAM-dependent methyltransferase
MDPQSRLDHWQQVYQTKTEQEVSWHQDQPEPSLSMVCAATASLTAPIIDIGGGASHLVDLLLQRGYRDLSVLDISPAALARARVRLGAPAAAIDWIAADITTWTPRRRYELWHDRATFHFMATEHDRAAYLDRLRQALLPGGHAVIATFSLQGPEKCSGLPVMRYDPETLARTLGREFTLVNSEHRLHQTPWSSVQAFQFSVFRRQSESA